MTTQCKRCENWVDEAILLFKEDKFILEKGKYNIDYNMYSEPICKSCFKRWLS